MKNILITGATGFIGKLLVSTLHKRCIVNVLLRKKCEGLWDESIVCDLEDWNVPDDALKNIDTVFHLAGVAHDTRSGVEEIYHRVNTESTIKLAKLAVKNEVKQFVFVSSVKAGGSATFGKCMTEDDCGEPEGIYGKTKREAELKVLEIGQQSGMHVSIIRPSLVYGPNVKGNLGMMFKGIKEGWFPPLPKTPNLRSMVNIDDLVSAIILAAENGEADGEIFIVTDDKHYSTREIFEEMCVAVGREVPPWAIPKFIFFLLAKLGDFMNIFGSFPFNSYHLNKLLGDDCYCSDKIRKKLGFKSKMTLRDVLPNMAGNIET